MFHAFSIVPGYRTHEVSKKPTAADHVSPLFPPEEGHVFSLRNIVGFKPDTVDTQACIFVMKLINNTGPATDLFLRPIWTVEVPCLYGMGPLAFLGF